MVQSNTSQASEVSSQETVLPAAKPSKLDPTFKTDWLKALRSGEYAQCRKSLRNGDGYCCLGVAAVVAGYIIHESTDTILRPNDTESETGSYRALEDFGLLNRSRVIEMNDAGCSFANIADYIEVNL